MAISKELALASGRRMVRKIANGIKTNLPKHILLEDLISEGDLALIEASQSYDESRGAGFVFFASHRVRGRILDFLRSTDWCSKEQRSRIKMIEEMRQTAKNGGRELSDEEIALELVLPIKTVRLLSSLNNVEHTNDRMLATVEDSGVQSPEQRCIQESRNKYLSEAMTQALPERYLLAVKLYYFDGLFMKQIGDVMGINESRVSQILQSSLRKLKDKIKREAV